MKIELTREGEREREQVIARGACQCAQYARYAELVAAAALCLRRCCRFERICAFSAQ